MQRECFECHHIELAHFEQRCHRRSKWKDCDCTGFAARELTPEEKKISEEIKKARYQRRVEYSNEAWESDLARDWKDRDIE